MTGTSPATMSLQGRDVRTSAVRLGLKGLVPHIDHHRRRDGLNGLAPFRPGDGNLEALHKTGRRLVQRLRAAVEAHLSVRDQRSLQAASHARGVDSTRGTSSVQLPGARGAQAVPRRAAVRAFALGVGVVPRATKVSADIGLHGVVRMVHCRVAPHRPVHQARAVRLVLAG